MKKTLFIIIAVVLFLTVGFFLTLIYFGSDMTIDNDTKVVIEEGSSTEIIGTVLEEAGLIKNSSYFRLFAKCNDVDNLFKAGTYTFTAGRWSVAAVSDMLVTGTLRSEGEIQVTIVEGLTVAQTAQQLADAGIGQVENYLQYARKGDFSQYDYIPAVGTEIEPATRLEGFLFPDTYMIDPTWSEADIIDMLLAQFAYVWESNGYQELVDAAGYSVYDIVTMASLVEKEAKIKEDRPLIAGVFYKRMDMGMKLESCATVQFILGEPKEVLLYSDTKIDNPYNTYLYEGLPPGPICCPGKAAIEAALHPTVSDYLYFRARTDGSHRFSVTFEEHSTYHEGDQ